MHTLTPFCSTTGRRHSDMRRHGWSAGPWQEPDRPERLVLCCYPMTGRDNLWKRYVDGLTPWLTSAVAVVRYLGWLSITARCFNVGSYRRSATPQPNASFFDVANKEGERLRRAAAESAVNDMCQWFRRFQGHRVAILDATNSTKTRRRWIKDRCDAQGIATLFVESKCDREDIIMSNILEVKTTSPDYQGQDPEEAARDFLERIRMYDRVYETLGGEDESDLTYCKIIDVGSRVIINRIQDYLQSRVVYYLMNLHIKPRSIWISRVSAPPFPTHFLLTVCGHCI